MSAMSNPETVAFFEGEYREMKVRYGDMKKQLAEDMVRFISPIRKRVDDILNDEAYLQKVMKTGAEKAIASAEATMQKVRNAMGLNYF